MKKIIIIIILFLFSSCYTKHKSYIVVGHESKFDKDTINLVRRIDNKCANKVYPVGTVICRGRLKIVK